MRDLFELLGEAVDRENEARKVLNDAKDRRNEVVISNLETFVNSGVVSLKVNHRMLQHRRHQAKQ